MPCWQRPISGEISGLDADPVAQPCFPDLGSGQLAHERQVEDSGAQALVRPAQATS
jgi:hypothetical protein